MCLIFAQARLSENILTTKYSRFTVVKIIQCMYIITVFIRIVAAATINFSLTGVRLLIEGGSYSRKAFIYFGEIPLRRSGGIFL